jgi:hypothetical protein
MKIQKEKVSEIKALTKDIVAFEKDAKLPSAIKDDKTYKAVIEYQILAKDKFKKSEEDRKFIVQPLNDQIKRINDRFKKITEPLSKIIDASKEMILSYRKESKQILEEKQLQLEAEWKKNGKKKGEIMPTLGDLPNKLRTDYGDIVFKKDTIIRIKNEKKVPEKFWSVDEKKVKEAINNGEEVPGVIVEESENFAVFTDVE